MADPQQAMTQQMNVDPTVTPFVEAGTTGLKRWGGRIYEEFLRELSGRRGVETFREMSQNDPVIGGILFAIEMLLRNCEWKVEPASDDLPDVEAAEFLESCLEDMQQPWSETIAEIMSMLPYGWALFEEVYKMRHGATGDPMTDSRFQDGRVGWRKLAFRAQETLLRWTFDENGEVTEFIQQAPPDYKYRVIPMTKALLFRTSSHKGNPEGRSALRNAYRPWFFKKHVENMEAIGIERDLAGLPVIGVPPRILSQSATDDEKQALAAYQKIVRNLKRDEQEGIVFPLSFDEFGNKQYELTLLNTGGTRQFDTTGIINRYDQRIAMTVLADFVLLGHEKVGSHALSSSKMSMFSTAVGSWLGMIAEVFNRTAIPRLFKMNNFAIQKMPKLTHADVESVDLTELAGYIQALTGAGAQLFPNKDLEAHLMRQAGLPTQDDHAGYADDIQEPGDANTNDGVPSLDPNGNVINEDQDATNGVPIVEQHFGADGSVLPQQPPAEAPVEQHFGADGSVLPQQPTATAAPAAAAPPAHHDPSAVLAGATAPAAPVAAPTPSLGDLQANVTAPDAAMSGVQITSMMAIVTSVAERLIPRESGIALLIAGFNLKQELADMIMGPVGITFFAAAPAPAAPAFGHPGGAA